jgi:hypothetical protein
MVIDDWAMALDDGAGNGGTSGRRRGTISVGVRRCWTSQPPISRWHGWHPLNPTLKWQIGLGSAGSQCATRLVNEGRIHAKAARGKPWIRPERSAKGALRLLPCAEVGTRTAVFLKFLSGHDGLALCPEKAGTRFLGSKEHFAAIIESQRRFVS